VGRRADRTMTMRVALVVVVVFLLVGCACSAPRVVHSTGQAPKGVYHVVERHQTLWRICKTYGASMDEVARVNRIRDKNRIMAGQRLFIPGAAKVLKVDVYIEDVTARKTRKVTYTKSRFIWPVRGPVTKGEVRSGSTRPTGIKINAREGTPVRAADSGRIVYSDDQIRGYGNLIIIEHNDEFFTIYGHNQINLVKEEARVSKGQVIARVGATGTTSTATLHFEIRQGRKALDPLRFLP